MIMKSSGLPLLFFCAFLIVFVAPKIKKLCTKIARESVLKPFVSKIERGSPAGHGSSVRKYNRVILLGKFVVYSMQEFCQ